MVERAWLIDSVVSGARIAGTSAGARRDKALGTMAASQYLDFAVTRAAPPIVQESGSLFAEGLRQSIARGIGVPAARVAVMTAVYDEQNMERSARQRDRGHSRASGGAPLGNAGEQRKQRAWRTRHFGEAGGWRLADRDAAQSDDIVASLCARIAFGIVGNLLIVILFSVWIARSIVVPLTRLSAAIESLGRNREPTLIDEMRLPEYAAIAESFNTMQLRLKRFIDERMGMLAAISHDLRTPLTRLRLMAEYVDNPEQREQLLLNVGEMETMVGDALAFMRAEARSEKVEVVDLAVLLISLTDEYSDFGNRVSYVGPEHADLPCRPVALKRAFSNLIANGCKYGGAVEVRLIVTADAFAVDVHDEGEGIPPEYEEKAFLALRAARNVAKPRDGRVGAGARDQPRHRRAATPARSASGARRKASSSMWLPRPAA